MSVFVSNPYNSLSLPIMFTGNPLDRMDAERHNDAREEKWTSDPDARYMGFTDDKIITDADKKIKWLTFTEIANFTTGDQIFLGLTPSGHPRFAVAIKDFTPEEDGPYRLKDLRSLAFAAGKPEKGLAIAAQGKSMLDWHRNHPFCSKCGAPSELKKMGYERVCPSCNTSHFPRTDPVVIMLGIHKASDSILVGRPHNLYEGVYTALAGFMEPGETIEEATARELYEEAGVKVTNVRYIASQPWPYPSTLMIGCIADIEDKTLTIDTSELDDARWITRTEAEEIMDGRHKSMAFPPALAIARQLIDFWLAEEASS